MRSSFSLQFTLNARSLLWISWWCCFYLPILLIHWNLSMKQCECCTICWLLHSLLHFYWMGPYSGIAITVFTVSFVCIQFLFLHQSIGCSQFMASIQIQCESCRPNNPFAVCIKYLKPFVLLESLLPLLLLLLLLQLFSSTVSVFIIPNKMRIDTR